MSFDQDCVLRDKFHNFDEIGNWVEEIKMEGEQWREEVRKENEKWRNEVRKWRLVSIVLGLVSVLLSVSQYILFILS